MCSVCVGDETCRVDACRPVVVPQQSTPTVRHPGDVRVHWTFNGLGCQTVNNVERVQVDLPGIALPNHGSFACMSGALDGLLIPNLPAGLYAISLKGLSRDGAVLYEYFGHFRVDGPVSPFFDLQPTNAATSDLLVSWQLPWGAVSCSSAGLSSVWLSVDGWPAGSSSCDLAGGSVGVLVSGLQPGAHTLVIEGRDAAGFTLSISTVSLVTIAGATIAVSGSLEWVTGGATAQWRLFDSGFARTCLEAGVSEVYVNLATADGTFVYSGAGVALPCTSGGVVFSPLVVGPYALYAQAYDRFGRLLRSDFVRPPTFHVRAGIFPVVDGSSPLLALTP